MNVDPDFTGQSELISVISSGFTENESGQTGGAAEVEHDFERVLARGALLAVAVHVAP